jgi:hypothetical protein
LFSITRRYIPYNLRCVKKYLFLKLNCYLRFQNPIRIFCCLEHIFAANLDLWSLSRDCKQCTPRVLYDLFSNHLFWKIWYIPAEIPKFIFFTKRASNFATRDGTVKFWIIRHEIILREVSYNRKIACLTRSTGFNLPNLQVELLWWW